MDLKASIALALCLMLATPYVSGKNKGVRSKKELTKICKEELPNANNKEIKKCVRQKIKSNKNN